MAQKKEYNYCKKCGRRLKDPIARKLGYGKECANKIVYKPSKRLFEN